MPVYLYKCKTCGHEFDYEQRITDSALTKCVKELCYGECKGEGDVIRKISKNVGLVFNGSGFYLTDYKNKKSVIASGDSQKSNGSAKTETTEKATTPIKANVSENK
ncbi:MAG: hypothetical protein NT007_17095 [Candidatus Kapabacteria bacterium]|nr:hypothetical protein [Candidatus Kapabacteria bacterium]